MIRQHSTRNSSGTIRRMVETVQGDTRGEIKNGYPEPLRYMPRGLTPGQQERLDELLGYRNTSGEDSASTTEQGSNQT